MSLAIRIFLCITGFSRFHHIFLSFAWVLHGLRHLDFLTLARFFGVWKGFFRLTTFFLCLASFEVYKDFWNVARFLWALFAYLCFAKFFLGEIFSDFCESCGSCLDFAICFLSLLSFSFLIFRCCTELCFCFNLARFLLNFTTFFWVLWILFCEADFFCFASWFLSFQLLLRCARSFLSLTNVFGALTCLGRGL